MKKTATSCTLIIAVYAQLTYVYISCTFVKSATV